MANIDRILRAVEAQPWAIQREKLHVIAQVLAARAEAGAFPDAAEIEAAEARSSQSIATQGAIAVLPLHGTISRRMGMLEAMSGGCSVESFQKAFRQAMADDSISSILVNIHSPGGSVYGVEECARMIYEARDQKRIVAVADQLAASAAYYIGSAAGEFVITPSGEVGSIGVFMVHFDWSANLEDAGIKATIIKAGENKAEGNPYEALPEDARAHFQSLIDDYYTQFVGAVAKHRGLSAEQVKERFGRGRTFTAQRALERGMVDRIATVEEVVEDLLRSSSNAPGRRMSAAGIRDALHALRGETDEAIPIAAMAPDATDGGEDAALQGAVDSALSCLNAALCGGEAPARASRSTEVAPEGRDPTRATPTNVPDAAGGRAASADTDVPTESAPVAKEETMSGMDTAAPNTGAKQDQEPTRAQILEQERERVRALRQIGQDHSIEAEDVNGWIDSGLTPEQASHAALAIIRNRDAAAPNVRVTGDREAEKPFRSLGEQLIAVASAGGPKTDKRLLRLNEQFERHAAASGASSTVPSDGGFVIQPDFAEGITTKMWDEGRVLSRTNRVPIGESANGLVRNRLKEASRKDGSRYGGVRVYRAAEADTVEGSKAKLVQDRIHLEKLMGIFYATEELMQDATAMTSVAETGFRRELTFVAENEIFRGTGAAQCLGFLNSDALVTVSKESGQTAATVNATNVAKMMGRLPAGSFPTAAWFIHSSVIPQLVLMTIGDQPVFLPGGSIAGAPFGTLFGMPVIPAEYCATAGTAGDICLVDLQQYTTIDKGGADWQESIHVRFLYDETAFKLTYRFNGQPDWEDAVAEFQGSDEISPFITLEARS